ncbi:MAG TPA: hypothetical protein VL860_07635, partial [Planctomycetota bacterium]|nr:hypothetical protein [Planctomycetota bacterium]
ADVITYLSARSGVKIEVDPQAVEDGLTETHVAISHHDVATRKVLEDALRQAKLAAEVDANRVKVHARMDQPKALRDQADAKAAAALKEPIICKFGEGTDLETILTYLKDITDVWIEFDDQALEDDFGNTQLPEIIEDKPAIDVLQAVLKKVDAGYRLECGVVVVFQNHPPKAEPETPTPVENEKEEGTPPEGATAPAPADKTGAGQ